MLAVRDILLYIFYQLLSNVNPDYLSLSSIGSALSGRTATKRQGLSIKTAGEKFNLIFITVEANLCKRFVRDNMAKMYMVL